MSRADAATRRRQARRAQILAAARGCFERDGFHGASMAAIAAAAGMSIGHVYHYFDGKDAIVADIIRIDLEARLRILAALRRPAELASAMLSPARTASAGDTTLPLGPRLRAEIFVEAVRNPLAARLLADADAACLRRLRTLLNPPCLPDAAERGGPAAAELALALWDGLRVRGLVVGAQVDDCVLRLANVLSALAGHAGRPD
ncbi:TetR family transcriptional regulator [Pseudothauera nasutitermitis]|uniref:TetR family transcriptional regulator n=1 Tax=Pseudothauera nasutitermitis TaxID=2565930 RepID=A0A4S4AUM7_9RHOO|nr:TetR family transcriptional regulator [Pseudothauera nasutitermitis]THF63671.1 TetR family transcriptional regulator [Pseudothauera nasutitermitis]